MKTVEFDNDEPYLSTPGVIVQPGSCLAYGNPSNGGVKYAYHGDYTVSYNQSNTPKLGS